MSKELVDYDPMTGMRLYFDYDEVDRKIVLHHEQDVSHMLERNVMLQNEPDYKKEGIRNDWQHLAFIPDLVILRWRKEGIDVFNPDHHEAVMRKLRDPEYRKLRTTLGDI